MKILLAEMFLVFAFLNAILGGLMISLAMDLGWNIAVIAMTSAFMTTAILLARAPFSRKNIDALWVTILRWLVAAAHLAFICDVIVALFGGFDLGEVIVLMVSYLSTLLILFMKFLRRFMGTPVKIISAFN